MNKNQILQFPSGEESTLDEWAENDVQPKALEGSELTQERDKFLLWEVRRSLAPTIGRLIASTQGHEDT